MGMQIWILVVLLATTALARPEVVFSFTKAESRLDDDGPVSRVAPKSQTSTTTAAATTTSTQMPLMGWAVKDLAYHGCAENHTRDANGHCQKTAQLS